MPPLTLACLGHCVLFAYVGGIVFLCDGGDGDGKLDSADSVCDNVDVFCDVIIVLIVVSESHEFVCVDACVGSACATSSNMSAKLSIIYHKPSCASHHLSRWC